MHIKKVDNAEDNDLDAVKFVICHKLFNIFNSFLLEKWFRMQYLRVTEATVKIMVWKIDKVKAFSTPIPISTKREI